MFKKSLVLISGVLFVLFITNTTATVIYSRSAESKAKEAEATALKVEKQLEALRITTQNKCIISLILRYPSPIPDEQLSIVLKEYDACIVAQDVEIEEEIIKK